MSRSKDIVGEQYEQMALEYVSGTLRGEERKDFELHLQDNPKTQAAVQFWEEHLMSLHQDNPARQPMPNNWTLIEKGINAKTSSSHAGDKKNAWWALPYKWIGVTAFSVVWAITVTLWSFGLSQNTHTPNSDYVAVLSSSDGSPMLTALTSKDGKNLWLQWGNTIERTDGSLQLWAQSRRDNEIRPIAVLSSTENTLVIDEALYRLIQDSSFLILTAEELGGSAFDEPSDTLIAKGACVRLNNNS